MEIDFEGSLTPPCSPCSEPGFTHLEIFPSFSCLSSSPDSSCTENHLAYGCLKRMFLHLDPSPCCFERDTTSLFGFPVVTETALFDSPGLLFGLLRFVALSFCLFYFCRTSVQQLHTECETLRLKCARFLSYCKAAVFSPSWYLLHLHLDLRWSVLEILQILSHCTAGNLLFLFREMILSIQEELATSPFYCACTRDFWILLQNLLDHRTDGSDRKVRKLVPHAYTESVSLLETCQVSCDGLLVGSGAAYHSVDDPFATCIPVSFLVSCVIFLMTEWHNFLCIIIKGNYSTQSQKLTCCFFLIIVPGRFYTKFHQRRLSELTDNGLHNFFFIFLVVATRPDEFEEVTCRLIELLECLKPSSLSVGQRMNIWRGEPHRSSFVVFHCDLKFSDLKPLTSKSIGFSVETTSTTW
uniref:Protein MMS22-like N-terminal domain-containing protein n=1 Tax=Eptatretus burgeri TaxID=7764 RepID=A0A8C4RBQ2_EPTBU